MLSAEAKVGAMSLAGLLALFLVFFTLNNFQWQKNGYTIKAVFSQVGGLKIGSSVRAAGVDVGKVESMKLTNQGVVVAMHLEDDVQIPENSGFAIRTVGLMGDKYVEITPNHQIASYLKPGQTVKGDNLMEMDQVMNQAGATLEEVKKLAASFNEIVAQKEFKDSMRESVANLAKIMDNLNSLTAVLNTMALDNQQDVRFLVVNLREMSANMNATSGDVRSLAHDIQANGETAKKFKTILDNLEYTTKKASKIADDIESFTGDENLKKDLRSTVSQVKGTVEKTNELLSSFQQTKTSFSYEGQYGSETHQLHSTVNLKVNPNDKQFYILGLYNHNDTNKINVQLGRNLTNSVSFRAGLFKGFMGVALNKEFNDKFSLEGQLTNDEDARFNVRTQYSVRPNLSLTLQEDNIFGNGKRETNIGLQQKF